MSAAAVFPSIILAIVAAFVASGFLVYDYSWSVMAFPFGAGVATCALCALEIIRCLAGRAPLAEQASAAALEPLSLQSLAWMFSLALFLYGLGFVAGPALYLLVCLRANGQTWGLSLGMAAASVAVTWGVFVKALGVLLPLWPLWF
jgi:hypothetical protein